MEKKNLFSANRGTWQLEILEGKYSLELARLLGNDLETYEGRAIYSCLCTLVFV